MKSGVEHDPTSIVPQNADKEHVWTKPKMFKNVLVGLHPVFDDPLQK